MVRRQGSRFGVVTNQSVRRSNVSASQDVSQYVVIKTMSKASLSAKENKRVLVDYSQQIQDGNLASSSEISEKDPNPIMYSLNKHRRWELPEMLKENILDQENHTESKFQVTLSERHIGSTNFGESLHSGDCIGIHQSKSDHPERLPKSTYAYEADLAGAEKKGRRSKRRKNKSRRVEMEEEEVIAEENLIPEIHYEVCYPRPKNKYQNYGRMSKNSDVTVKSGKKSNKKSQIGWMDFNDEEDYDEFFDEEAFVAHDNIPSRLAHDDYSPVTLGNVLVTLLIDAVCSQPEQDKPKQRRRHCSKASVSSQEDSDFETKDHIVVIDKEEIERFQPKDIPVEPHTPQPNRHVRKRARRAKNQTQQEPEPQSPKVEITPVDPDMKFMKKISVNSFKSDYLQGTFGECYVEGHCLPRRFVINMKPAVEAHLINKGYERTAKTCNESSHQMLLLFEPFGCVEAVLGNNQPAFQQVRMKVCGFPQDFLQKMSHFNQAYCLCHASPYPYEAVKMAPPEGTLNKAHAPHSQLCVDHIWSVAEIVEFFKTTIAHMTPESFYREDGAIGWAAKQPPVTLETVKTVTRIDWHSSTPRAILQNIQEEVDSPEANSSTDTKPTHCNICYDTLLTSVSGVDASALGACGHWFCNECWTQHLKSRVKRGDINISCPEFDCSTPVDKVLLLAYLTQKEFRTQTIHHRNTTLNSHPDWRWCPNNACGRLVKTVGKSGSKVDQDDTVAINCECGLLWCSSCKGEGHWPATCQQAAAYWKLIKKNGSILWKQFTGVGDIQHVRVKKCPFCRNLIEKHSGCNYMYCVCRKAFCWECLQDYESHDWNRCRDIQKQLQKVTLLLDKPMVSSMPGVALQHRERRTRLAVRKRRKAAEILAKKAFLIRQGPKEPSVPRLPQIDDTSSVVSSSSTSSSILSGTSYKSLPMTWIHDDESSWQLLQDLLETAANAATFCSEAEFCLEHLEVMCNDPNTELRSAATLHQLKDRLIFITDQLHMILHSEIKVNADCAMGRVVILMNAGKKCLKWIAANIPFVLAQESDE